MLAEKSIGLATVNSNLILCVSDVNECLSCHSTATDLLEVRGASLHNFFSVQTLHVYTHVYSSTVGNKEE